MGNPGDDDRLRALHDLGGLLHEIATTLKAQGVECVILARNIVTDDTKIVMALAEDGPLAAKRNEIIAALLKPIGAEVDSVNGIKFTAPGISKGNA